MLHLTQRAWGTPGLDRVYVSSERQEQWTHDETKL
jgi:hypothetical protein